MKKFWNSFPHPKKCFSSPVQKWTWCKDSLGQRSPLISATFRLTCSNQCWMLVSKDLQSCRPTTIWWSATCVWKTNRAYTNVPDWRCQLIKCEVDKNVRKTSADSVLSLFREFSWCAGVSNVERQLFAAAVASSAARVCGWKPLGVANHD